MRVNDYELLTYKLFDYYLLTAASIKYFSIFVVFSIIRNAINMRKMRFIEKPQQYIEIHEI